MRKKRTNGKRFTTVTFEVPAELGAQRAVVVGDFNDWSLSSPTPLKPRRDGSHAASVRLENGRPYRFRYLLDDERWENDWQADRYEPNPFGTEDSVVEV